MREADQAKSLSQTACRILDVDQYMYMKQNIVVAVRVRSFTKKQIESKQQNVIKMEGRSTILTQPVQKKIIHSFDYNFSYWSFDDFQADRTGYLRPLEGGRYADQRTVYNDIGTKLLQKAMQGYNSTILAYGQTGSGKTYSTFGYGVNEGLIPMLLKQISSRSQSESIKKTTMKFSMIEIYNELVYDLMDQNRRQRHPLEVRQNNDNFYVQGLKKYVVSSYKEFQILLEKGKLKKSIACTSMNQYSSRAHTLVQLQITQERADSRLVSILNLVDLAGSERQKSTEARDVRLIQAAGINKSLTHLGIVIRQLIQNKRHISYRNSTLTRLLKNALGGNSFTIMLCSISPASCNYHETLSTLRYAQSAKAISNSPVVNIQKSRQQILNQRVKYLQERNRQLQSQIKQLKQQTGAKESEGVTSRHLICPIAEEQEKGLLYGVAESSASQPQTDRLNYPFFINISIDQSITKTIKFPIKKQEFTVGANKESDLWICHPFIKNKHAVVRSSQGILTIYQEQMSKIYINASLKHMDRIIFGYNNCFLFINPTQKQSQYEEKVIGVDFEQFRKDINTHDIEVQTIQPDQSSCCSLI